MPQTSMSHFARAVTTAQRWLADVESELGTDDSEFAYRITKAWLQTLRDRLPVIEAAHLAAQLPELLRGMYYEGWQPTNVPIKYDLAGFTRRFASIAGISPDEVHSAACAVSQAFDRRMSGHLALVVTQLPPDLRALIQPRPPMPLRELLG